MTHRLLTIVLLSCALSACGGNDAQEAGNAIAADKQFANLDAERLANADQEPHNWFMTNRASSEDHYSPLDAINQKNVARLGFAWEYRTNTKRGLEASPLVIDGVMFTSGNWGKVYAVEAASGREIWTFDPGAEGAWGRRPCCDVVNRGVAAWKGKIYVGSIDGYLIALDAKTGKQIWRQDTLLDRTRFQSITGAPKIAGDKVVIGNGGAELGVRGFVTAFDAETGQLAWRFFTVPGDPKLPFEHPELELASKTWDPNSMWDVGGGGTAWDAMAYDPELNLLYVGTGNGSPHSRYSRSPSGGDNLFICSILAIDPSTGRLKWHYQTTPGESWDYTSTQHLVLAELMHDGVKRKVIMQAPKNGFYYVLDRSTGELLSAEKFGKVNWASHIDLKTGRPVFTDQGDFSKSPKLVYPGQAGVHNWHPMSFSAQTGLMYIPHFEMPAVYVFKPVKHYQPGKSNEHVDLLDYGDPLVKSQVPAGVPPLSMASLQAWDPVAQEERWRVPIANSFLIGGALSTAGGLVLQGTPAGFLSVYAADTGQLLASINVGTGIIAAPISYAVNGEQYIAVMAGAGGAGAWNFAKNTAAYRYGNEGRIVAFKLGGGAVPLPPIVDRTVSVAPPPDVPSSPQMIARGEELFVQARCYNCHNIGEPGIAPDLSMLTLEKHRIFKEIVFDGVFKGNGMAAFSDILSVEDVAAIHAYVVDATKKKRQ